MVFGAVFSVLLNRFLYTPFIRRGARLFTMIIVTIAVSLILQNCLLAIWGSKLFQRAHLRRRHGQARLTQRPGGGRSPVHWVDWLDPGLYMTHNPRHGR